MRVIVTGDRNWTAPELAEEVLNRLLARYGPNLVIVHGAATGIDRSFAEACGDLGIEQEAHPARWEVLDRPEAVIRYDKRNRPYNANAGPIRNADSASMTPIRSPATSAPCTLPKPPNATVTKATMASVSPTVGEV